MLTEETKKSCEELNEKLGLNKKLGENRDNNIIFVYCPVKVGSTSLVSSLRIFGSPFFSVLHFHDDAPFKYLITNKSVTIMDLIHYNRFLGKRVWVFDVYRTPIERKMSEFFEYLCDYHFNTNEKTINDYKILKLVDRFNHLFPHISNDDYYLDKYGLVLPESFDFEKKYIYQEVDGIKFIKLRLTDSHLWGDILTELLHLEVKIVKDYQTDKKIIGELYKRFKNEYRLPVNYLEEIKKDSSFLYYNTEEERNDYLGKIILGDPFKPYNDVEYNLYQSITIENCKGYIVQNGHYIDEGCICKLCTIKRQKRKKCIKEGKECNEVIWHEKNKKIFIRTTPILKEKKVSMKIEKVS